MPPPFVAIVRTRDAANAPVRTPSQLNERLREVVAPQKAPEKPRQGDVPARPARMPMYSVLAKRQWWSVTADNQSGVMGKTEFQQFTSHPFGKSLTWDERANIQHKFAESYGGNFNVVPQTPDEARLRSLLRM